MNSPWTTRRNRARRLGSRSRKRRSQLTSIGTCLRTRRLALSDQTRFKLGFIRRELVKRTQRKDLLSWTLALPSTRWNFQQSPFLDSVAEVHHRRVLKVRFPATAAIRGLSLCRRRCLHHQAALLHQLSFRQMNFPNVVKTRNWANGRTRLCLGRKV